MGMALYVDNITTHGDDNTGNNTVPPGITGLDWCHLISDTEGQIESFLDAHPEIGQPSSNVRTPPDSNITYAGLDATMRDAAVAAVAADAAELAAENCQRGRLFVLAHSFDAGSGTWEP